MKNRRVASAILLTAWIIWLPLSLPALGAGAGRDDQSEEPAEKEVKPVSRYLLEKPMDTDQSVQTWLYVFSAVMLLLIGWLCFKPTRVEKPKPRRAVAAKKGVQRPQK